VRKPQISKVVRAPASASMQAFDGMPSSLIERVRTSSNASDVVPTKPRDFVKPFVLEACISDEYRFAVERQDAREVEQKLTVSDPARVVLLCEHARVQRQRSAVAAKLGAEFHVISAGAGPIHGDHGSLDTAKKPIRQGAVERRDLSMQSAITQQSVDGFDAMFVACRPR
jgi:hypothetical protein